MFCNQCGKGIAVMISLHTAVGIQLAEAGEPHRADITAAAFGDINDASDGGQPMGKGGELMKIPQYAL